jgi:hypothetical protein
MRQGLRGVGLGEKQIEAMLGMSVGLRENFTPEQKRSVHTMTPSTLGAWALRPAALARHRLALPAMRESERLIRPGHVISSSVQGLPGVGRRWSVGSART